MSLNPITNLTMKQAKHARKLDALNRKPISKWNADDFGELQATRAERDSAVAALNSSEHVKVFGRPIQKESVTGKDVLS